MEFRTKVNIPVSPDKINHQDKMLLIGSCFTENIGHFLQEYRFDVAINPFGIVYNPISTVQQIQRIAANTPYTEEDILHCNELYLSLDHHGSFSGTDKQQVLDSINNHLKESHDAYLAARYIVLTLGTAWVYRHLESDRIVANCHKIPTSRFEKRLLSIGEITSAFDAVQPLLKDKKVIFTVSPVRHWRDGAVENQRSKSILTESIHQLLDNNANWSYFPAYEIMMDELRDYRFYEADMLHPNAVAVRYIWQRFSETYFSVDTHQINNQIEKINLMLQHRIKNEQTKAEVAFKEHLKNTLADFKKAYPEIGKRF